MRRTYLDWAAGAPAGHASLQIHRKALAYFGNPSSPHLEGRMSREILEDARTRIARLASVKAEAVLFTAGATEANALAIVGQVRATGGHVLYLPSAHASTRGAVEMLAQEGFAVEPLALVDGAIDLVRLKEQLRADTTLIALEAVCGETGTRFDVRGVWRVLQALPPEQRPKVHVDASQLPLVESFALTRLGADTLSLDAQKVGGIRGIGALIAPRHTAIKPLMLGGGQERGLRPGTEAPALAAAFAVALEEAQEHAPAFKARAERMRRAFLARVDGKIERVVVNEGQESVPHIVNLSCLGRDTDYLAALLDEAGFAVSTRSACATDSEGSVAVAALFKDEERAKATLRISWGPDTKERELSRCADALINAVRFLDVNAIY